MRPTKARDHKAGSLSSAFATVTIAIVVALLTLVKPAMAASTYQIQPGQFLGTSTNLESHESFSLTDGALQSLPDSGPMLSETPVPGTTADAMIAVDLTSKVLLYENQADTAVAPASTLKIVTALTVLSVLDPDQEISVSQEDLVDTAVYSNAALAAGDILTVRDLLAGLLIPSGGDAANALARVAGEQLGPAPGQRPVERFMEEMNALAADIGMSGSNFVNPDGRDVANQYTTARDLAIAGARLLRSKQLSEIVAAPSWTMTVTGPNARSYVVINTNQLIGIDRVHGVKTGTTGEAGESIVLATRRAENQILTVVMGSEDRYGDTNTLLQHIDSQMRWVEFGPSEDFPGIQRAAERFGFLLAVPMVRPMLNVDSDRLSSELSLGPRPRPTLPVPWGYVVFLQGNEELYRVPVLAGSSSR